MKRKRIVGWTAGIYLSNGNPVYLVWNALARTRKDAEEMARVLRRAHGAPFKVRTGRIFLDPA